MEKKETHISEILEDVRIVLSPKNLSTMALPWLCFLRTMTQIAKEDTKNCAYINPINKLIINNYLGASMILEQTNLGARIYKHFEVGPGAGRKIFDTMTDSTGKAVSGAEDILEANELLLTAIIEELQALRKDDEEEGKGRSRGGKADPK